MLGVIPCPKDMLLTVVVNLFTNTLNKTLKIKGKSERAPQAFARRNNDFAMCVSNNQFFHLMLHPMDGV